jgi:hypothetical protein
MRDPEELTVLVSLMDFYSNRANAHASFSIAGLFGVYTIIFSGTIVRFPWWLFLIVLAFLTLLNFYSVYNFSFYTTASDAIRAKLLGEHYEEYVKLIDEHIYKYKRATLLFRFLLFRKFLGKNPQAKIFLFLAIYVFSVIMPAIWIAINSFSI